jgi:protein-L-isoaspartate(D-aspartate) O-methyltransferase
VAQADTASLRARLADHLVGQGLIRGRELELAFRDVPRHLFVPQVGPEQAYADEAIPVKWAPDGRPVSSSSQPAIMAIMLGQLGVRPGLRVLEIGTGTGYNAALLAHVVGDAGAVVTVDIDEGLSAAARARLAAVGSPWVTLACGDGAAGWAAGAPYDRIIVTASAPDLAPEWTSQLGPDGRLVLPLSLRGMQQSVAFKAVASETGGDHLASVSVVPCGFMPLAGRLAGPDPVRPLGPEPGVFLRLERSSRAEPGEVDPRALLDALRHPRRQVSTGVAITLADLFAGLGLWLALADARVGEVIALGQAVERSPVPVVPHFPGLAAATVLVGEASLAALTRPPGTPDGVAFDVGVRGYGPAGDDLADQLAAAVRAWDSAGRPDSSALRVRAYPAGAGAGEAAAFSIAMPHTRFLLDW